MLIQGASEIDRARKNNIETKLPHITGYMDAF